MRNFKLWIVGLALALSVTWMCGAAFAAEPGSKAPRKGILLVAFGTSVPEAQAVYRNIEKRIKAAFPEVPVRWAYTSQTIRHKLAKQKKVMDSPDMALARMADEGFTQVAVQSLHVIPGEEYEDLLETVAAFGRMPEGFDRLEVSPPLLFTPEDMKKAAAAILSQIPKARLPEEAVILMGHGTPHPADAFYPAMQHVFGRLDENVFVGTVEGYPALEDVMADLDRKKIKKAWLVPFMVVAGDHAMNDMAGPEPDSWKSRLGLAGISSEAVLKGLGANDEAVDIWVGHLAHLLNRWK